MALIGMKHGVMDVERVGEGRDLVVLHSLLAERSAFDRVVTTLGRGRRLWLFDLPGYGRSSATGTTIADQADAVAETMAALRLPAAETDVLGNGLGGFIALALAIRHGDRFDRLVLVDCLAGFPEAGKAPLRALAQVVREKGMDAALDTAVRRMFPPSYIDAHPDVVEERKRALRKMDPATFAKLCVALTEVEMAGDVARIRNRALVMAGELDATTAPELVRELASAIPQARFVTVPGCGHCPQIEQPETFVRLVEEFLGPAQA